MHAGESRRDALDANAVAASRGGRRRGCSGSAGRVVSLHRRVWGDRQDVLPKHRPHEGAQERQDRAGRRIQWNLGPPSAACSGARSTHVSRLLFNRPTKVTACQSPHRRDSPSSAGARASSSSTR
eukprot:2828504-Pyramimonas_sp.AAC.1